MLKILAIFVVAISCSSANAAMFNCIDQYGHATMRNYYCEEGETQQEIPARSTKSYSVIDRTGERQDYRTGEPEVIVYVERPPEQESASVKQERVAKEKDVALEKYLADRKIMLDEHTASQREKFPGLYGGKN